MLKYLFITLIAALMIKENGSTQSFWDMEPYEVRDYIHRKIFAIEVENPAVEKVADIKIKAGDRTTPLRVYTPSTCQQLPVILLTHGGAWIVGNLDTHDNMARYLCREVQALVFSVAYTNAPEGKFPLPLEQCYDALLWIVNHAREFHADTARLAVIGDSAGGNMTAALCLLARDRRGPTIDMQILINPAPDLTGRGTIQRQGDALDPVRWYATQYVKDPSDVNSPYVSPIVAKDLSYLPSAVVILAEQDDLRKDGQRYADRLISSGVPTNVYIQWGIGHLAGDGARASPAALESLDVAAAALRGTFFRKALMSPKKLL